MPPLKTQPNASNTPRTTVDALRRRETELKRSRGEISCAECRRLKLRCDRKIPCSSCLRRGCHSLCPNDTLLGTRLDKDVLSDTEALRLKLVEMSDRIGMLEDALIVVHDHDACGPHPLLCNDLKAIKYVVGLNIDSEENIPRHTHDPLDAFGALKMMITDDGESRFLGPTAGSEGILLSETGTEKREDDEKADSEVAPRLFELSRMWPFTPIDFPKEDIRIIIEAQLPTWERATALCEIYLVNIGVFALPIDREQIYEVLLPSIYKRPNSTHAKTDGAELKLTKVDNHDIALLLTVLACGAAGDLSRESKNDEGQLYYHLARVALGLQPIFKCASLSTVQAITLLAVYDRVSIRNSDREESWRVLSMAAIIAGSIGLHRDPGRWNLHPKVIERRRNAFWELYLICSWQSLSGGRPPPFVLGSIDAQLPNNPDSTTATNDISISNYKVWKLQFLKDCVAPVTDRLCANCAPLKYYEIVNLDKKIRDYDDLGVSHHEYDRRKNENNDLFPLRCIIFSYKNLLRSYLHRDFFAKAMTDFPSNPEKPSYGFSFITLFNNAIAFLDSFNQMRHNRSGWIIRHWSFMAHALECAFVVGTVLIRCPKPRYAIPAITSLESAIDLFSGIKHPVATKGLPILLRLREKARQATYQARDVPSDSLPVSSTDRKSDEEFDELSILRGTSRLVASSSDRFHLSRGAYDAAPERTNENDFNPEALPSHFFSELGTHIQQSPQGSVPTFAAEQIQIPPDPLPETKDFNILSEIYDRPGEQNALPELMTGNGFTHGQMFANLVPDAFIDSPSEVHSGSSSWNMEWSQFQY